MQNILQSVKKMPDKRKEELYDIYNKKENEAQTFIK